MYFSGLHVEANVLKRNAVSDSHCNHHREIMKQLAKIIEKQEQLEQKMDKISKFFYCVEYAVHGIERCLRYIIHLLTAHLNIPHIVRNEQINDQ